MDYFYEKKEIIEAFQLTEERRFNNVDWPEWLHRAWNKNPSEIGAVFPIGDSVVECNVNGEENEPNKKVIVRTLNGAVVCNIGDFIIKKEKDDLFCCSSDIFHKLYSKVKNWKIWKSQKMIRLL